MSIFPYLLYMLFNKPTNSHIQNKRSSGYNYKINNFPDHSDREDLGKELSFRSLKEIIDNLVGTQYLIKPYFELNSLSVMFGHSDAYKSFAALDIGLSVAYGLDYHGKKVHQGAVFYICGEGESGVGRRIEAWRKHNNVTSKDAPFFVSDIPAQLISERNISAITAKIDALAKKLKTRPCMITIDTLSTNIGDAEESSNKEMAKFFNNLRVYFRKEFNACVLIIHHNGHSDTNRERGASAIGANADCRIEVKRIDDETCQVNCIKMKDGEKWEPLVFHAKSVDLPDIKDSEGEISSSLAIELSDKSPITENTANQQLGNNEKQVYEFIEKLVDGNSDYKTGIPETDFKSIAKQHGIDIRNLTRTLNSLSKRMLITFQNGTIMLN